MRPRFYITMAASHGSVGITGCATISLHNRLLYPDMYYWYYATQTMHHMGGTYWREWNYKMKRVLLALQETDGHESGSWYFDEAHSSHGGRLYTTAMAIMTLEVYYRYMPLYQEFN